MPRTLGSLLHPADRAHVLAAFVHRYTKEHIPQWAKGTNYKPHFASDAEWLANTTFAVRKTDRRLDARFTGCQSSPTWPDGKGVDGRKGEDWS